MVNGHQQFEQWLSLARAAERLGSTPLNVLMHVKRGLLTGVEQDNGWMVDAESLVALLQKRREGAVPAVCQRGCAKKAGSCGGCT